MRGFRGCFMGGGFLMPIIWILAIGLGVYLITQMSNSDNEHKSQHRTSSEEKSPLEIARERYAKGEITKEEFNEIKEELEK